MKPPLPSIYTGYFQSPPGWILIGADEDVIISIRFADQYEKDWDLPSPLIRELISQLTAYFKGQLSRFDIPHSQAGTPFQQKVWGQLKEIPFGETITYAALASLLGKPEAIRAVAAANGKNMLNILIPCHRVIGAHNKLTGYNGGIDRKRWLLNHEHEFSMNKSHGSLFW